MFEDHLSFPLKNLEQNYHQAIFSLVKLNGQQKLFAFLIALIIEQSPCTSETQTSNRHFSIQLEVCRPVYQEQKKNLYLKYFEKNTTQVKQFFHNFR